MLQNKILLLCQMAGWMKSFQQLFFNDTYLPVVLTEGYTAQNNNVIVITITSELPSEIVYPIPHATNPTADIMTTCSNGQTRRTSDSHLLT